MTLTVGFDLDMTLVDSRAGIVATMAVTLAGHGVRVTDTDLWPHLGHPLERTFGHYLPAAAVEVAAEAYRREYLVSAVPVTTLLPGALESFEAIRALGGRVLVVSAKATPAVRAVLDHVGLHADEVHGYLFGEEKGRLLREHRADVYVGDHVGDVQGARVADAVAVVVTTGPNDRAALEAAGADVVLPSLRELPGWLREWDARRPRDNDGEPAASTG